MKIFIFFFVFCGWWYYHRLAVVNLDIVIVVVAVVVVLGERDILKPRCSAWRSTMMMMVLAAIDWEWAAASSRTPIISVAGVLTKGRNLGLANCIGLKAAVASADAAASTMAASTPIIVLAGCNKGSSLGLICHEFRAATASTVIVLVGNECAVVVVVVIVFSCHLPLPLSFCCR